MGMSREEAKKYIGELKMYANSQGWDEEYQIACDVAMNELEQEPILDKVRAEVENINVWGLRYNSDTDKDRKPQIVQKVKEHVIEIIDKYKAEVRDKYGNI